ncbi:MAG: hypothetical protein IT193_20155, partial [Propionibacteriaceae bacterium]|nr:hypothetical protein [Propionibacteriaceae bacterium]
MSAILREIWEALGDVLRITFVDPVREGRPRPSGWARGLPAIAASVLVVYALIACAAIFADPLRQWGDLDSVPGFGYALPTLTIPLFLCGIVLSFALAHTAALHGWWWLRIALFVTGAWVTVVFSGSNLDKLMVSGGAYLALAVFTVIRSRREFVWWEFPVVATLVGVGMLAPQTGWAGQQGQQLSAIFLAVGPLGELTVPALLVAGSVPAQIVVTGAAASARRPVGMVLFWAGSAAALCWLAFATIRGFQSGAAELHPTAFG